MINDGMSMKDEISLGVGKAIQDVIGMRGIFEAKLFDKFGNLKDSRKIFNTVTTLCHKMAADRILAAPAVISPGWMELGTGTGQTAASTTLATYIVASRTALDSKTRGANAIVTMICTFGAGVGTGVITEAGIFNVVTQNTTDLLTYADFAAVNKLAADSLVVTWTLTFA